jgi:hypothetical protein
MSADQLFSSQKAGLLTADARFAAVLTYCESLL